MKTPASNDIERREFWKANTKHKNRRIAVAQIGSLLSTLVLGSLFTLFLGELFLWDRRPGILTGECIGMTAIGVIGIYLLRRFAPWWGVDVEELDQD